MERLLTSRVVRLARVYRREVNRVLAGYGISDAQAVPVLYIARFGGGMRQNVLAEEIGIEGPSLVRLLDQLCGHGLVERRDDECDRRAKTLHLTAAGASLADEVEMALEHVRRSLLAPVADLDLATAVRVLGVLEDGLAARADSARGER
nr:MarR family transcriptional regulator [Rhabdochromatium marinum]